MDDPRRLLMTKAAREFKSQPKIIKEISLDLNLKSSRKILTGEQEKGKKYSCILDLEFKERS